MNNCYSCKYFRKNIGGIDCFNDDITQEDYEKHLGENEDNCLGYERESEN